MVIILQVDTRELRQVERFSRTFPEALQRSVEEIAKNTQKELRRSISLKGLSWTGRLREKTRARRKNKNTWELSMPQYGIYLDSMIPHFVSLKRGRKITKWARSKGIKASSLFVKPHPFIDRPMQIVSRRIRKIVDKHIRESTRRAK